MHAAARRTLMFQQLWGGLQLYCLVDIMEKNKEVCHGLFVFEGVNDLMRCIAFVKNVRAVVLISSPGDPLLWTAFLKSIVSLN